MNEPAFEILHPIDPISLADGVELSFQVIPPVAVQEKALDKGEPLSFVMGSRGYGDSEEPRHRVILSRPFYLGTFQVTQRQFACWRPGHENRFKGRPDHPAENMYWREARDFCRWVIETCRDDLPAGLEVRLPTEAQWEYACRAGTKTEYWSGDGEAALRKVAWFGEGLSDGSTHKVGGLPANPWGLHDMHGNVWEWCRDAWVIEGYGKRVAYSIDPYNEGGPDWLRVYRGGSWNYSARDCRSAVRFRFGRGCRYCYLGFRLCLSSGPVENQQAKRPEAQEEAERRREREGGTTDLASGGRLPGIPSA